MMPNYLYEFVKNNPEKQERKCRECSEDCYDISVD